MDNNGSKPKGKGQRYIIKAESQQYAEAIRRLYQSTLSRAQIHTILDITKGKVDNLRIARNERNKSIWFNFNGRRYDLTKNGKIKAETKIGGGQIQAPPSLTKEVKCPLCNTSNKVSKYDPKARCKECGFQLVRYRVNVKGESKNGQKSKNG